MNVPLNVIVPDVASNAPPDSEDALALVFAEEYGGTVRLVHEWNRFLHWDGKRWVKDRTNFAFDLARDICREAAQQAKEKDKARLASAKTVAAVVKMAGADRRIAATSDEWDTDPDLLNTPGGVVHLPTGDIRPHDPDLKLTKMTAAAPGGDCPLWLEFLDRITAGDESLVRYLQRMAGYALTGHTREHALFFGYGTGANGKSVLVNALRGILGDYAMVAAVETFMQTRNEQHPTSIASLRGARLVIANETEAGKAWAESRIKSLTGGDPQQARFMRADPFEFRPEFKLVVVGNHKPVLSSVDEAIRRRLHLIPFLVTIPVGERDEGLSGRLKSEWGGILQWAIEGAREWYADGLTAPACVTGATVEYLEEQDATAEWLASECETGNLPAHTTEDVKDLFVSWSEWAKAAGENPGSKKAFSESLSGKGFEKGRKTGGVRVFKQIRLKRANYSEQEGY